MKALSLRQASRCETAKTPKCKCRCGGLLHGVRRTTIEEDPKFFEALPADDPHHIDSAEAKKEKRRKRTTPDNSGQKRIKPEQLRTTSEPERQLPLFPPGLEQEMLGVCAECGHDEWVHHAYWREDFIGADHEFKPKEQQR